MFFEINLSCKQYNRCNIISLYINNEHLHFIRYLTNLQNKSLSYNFLINMFVRVCNNMDYNVKVQLLWGTLKIPAQVRLLVNACRKQL